ncbi:hypothetical protein [Paenibacillus piri]|uniref:Helix-turn-helix domain-containing protein n=1 Tax=Paenibacillus piri TaxID=2547395 RepID=A0A4R5KEQ1_9BACL|nr:hypothetical protein [Paenibacillus piri]TDF93821.1 hypothetical protein E1757_25910 [Paenibacillus piri]
MNVSNCSGCGKLQRQAAGSMCSGCLRRHIEDSHTVKALLQANPGANIMDIAERTGFSLKKINELVGR